MITVNAIKIRNHLGEVLDILNTSGEPILVSRGREIKAVLITLDQFKTRFLDYQAEEKKKQLLETLKNLKVSKTEKISSLDILREFRGYNK